MSDTTLLYLGLICFTLMLVGIGLTMHEFRKMSGSRNKRADPTPMKSPPVAAAKGAASRSR